MNHLSSHLTTQMMSFHRPDPAEYLFPASEWTCEAGRGDETRRRQLFRFHRGTPIDRTTKPRPSCPAKAPGARSQSSPPNSAERLFISKKCG